MKDKGDFEILLEKYAGRVPDHIEALLELPGVGRTSCPLCAC
jgi:endonuclease III